MYVHNLDIDRTDKNPESKFSINQAMQKISFHNQELTLTQTEFKILSHLIEHPNQSSYTGIFDEKYMG